jgi:peroxiredoxin
VDQLGELEQRADEFREAGDLVAVGYDTPASLKQSQAGSGASFPLLSDMDLTVTRLYDMQLRPNWPMGGMGDIPEMGYVVVGADGLIRLQRVDLHFGDHAGDILQVMKSK